MIKEIKKIFSLFVLFVLIQNIFAQKDSAVSLFPVKGYFYESDFLNDINIKKIDTSMFLFHQYVNDREFGNLFAFLGNAGTAIKPLVFDKYDIDFNESYFSAYSSYMLKSETIKYYQLKRPLTELYYMMGGKKEQYFNVLHSQNITKNWNASFIFKVLDSPGTYLRQETYHTNFAFNTNYHTKNGKYRVFANFIYNKIINSESGGISADSLFEDNLESQRMTIPVFLENAENRIRNFQINIKQTYTLSYIKGIVKDSIKTFKTIKLGKLFQEISYHRYTTAYIDPAPLSGYYPTAFNSEKTYDSTRIHFITGTLGWLSPKIKMTKSTSFYIIPSFRYNYYSIYNNSNINYYNEYLPNVSVIIENSSFIIKTGAEYLYDEKFTDNFKLDIESKLNLKTNLSIDLSAKYIVQEPWFYYRNYSSNHYRWKNEFFNEKTFKANFQLNIFKHSLSVNYYHIENFLFFNEVAKPEQTDKITNVVSAELKNHIVLWKLHFVNSFTFQYGFKSNALHLPLIADNFLLYAEFNVFKKALRTQIGFDLFYNTSYYADAYMPVTRAFYLQNEVEIGNYLYGDVFLTLRVKRARIFLKYQHVNSGLFGYKYYSTPHYPMQDRALKFGVSWMFYD